MNKVFNSEVIGPVYDHPETTKGKNNKLFGFPFNVVQDEVLQAGRADFTKSLQHQEYGKLTKEQLVLLYCFLYMKRHFYSSYANFRLSESLLTSLFEDAESVIMIDIGCGPGTAGLALAELFDCSFNYYGVDRSVAMRNKARSTMKKGKTMGLVNQATSVVCKTSWTDIPTQFRKRSAVIFNFSFFFSSAFLKPRDITKLASMINSIRKTQNVSEVVIAYTNSDKGIACENYKIFLSKIGLNYHVQPPTKENVYFYRSMKKDSEGNEEFMRELYRIV